jgi:hypothetical protein
MGTNGDQAQPMIFLGIFFAKWIFFKMANMIFQIFSCQILIFWEKNLNH